VPDTTPLVVVTLKLPPASPSLKLPLLALPPKLALTLVLLFWQIVAAPSVGVVAVAAGFTVRLPVEVAAAQPPLPSGSLVAKVIVVVPE